MPKLSQNILPQNKSEIILAILLFLFSFIFVHPKPLYHNLERKLNLKNTLSGFDNTWPTFFPFPIFQLDHILISQNLKLINSQVLENAGSDHLPIMSEINLPNFNLLKKKFYCCQNF